MHPNQEAIQRMREEAARLKAALRHEVARHDHMAHALGTDLHY